MQKGEVVVQVRDVDGEFETDIRVYPPINDAQRRGEEDLQDIQVVAGLLAHFLTLMFESDSEEESEETVES